MAGNPSHPRSFEIRSATASAVVLSTLALALVALFAPAGAGAATPAAPKVGATLYNVPTGNAGLDSIASGPGGALWFGENTADKLGRITTGGQVSEYPIPNEGFAENIGPDNLVASGGYVYFINSDGQQLMRADPADPGHPAVLRQSDDWALHIASGPGGTFWFSDWPDDTVYHVSAGLQATSYPTDMDDAFADTFAGGPDGSVWFTALTGDGRYIREITADGQSGSVALPDEIGDVTSIGFDRSGRAWYTRYTTGGFITEDSGGWIGWIDSNLQAHEIDLKGDYIPHSIELGPDGAMWFAEKHGIGRITAKGKVSHWSVAPYSVDEMAFGPDGAIWFIDKGANRIGRIGISPAVGLTVPKQKLAAVRKRGLTATCRLAASGRCAVVAQIKGKQARKIGLKAGKKAKAVTIGHGSKALKKAGRAKVRVKLTPKARKALAKAKVRAVAVTLTATAAARDSIPSQASRTVRVKR